MWSAGWDWNWKNPELNEWFASRLVDFILLTGADGFRADCAPFSAGYGPYRTARERLLSFGRKIILFGENGSTREKTFDFDQNAFMLPHKKPRMRGDVFMEKNIVDMIKNGEELGWFDGRGAFSENGFPAMTAHTATSAVTPPREIRSRSVTG